MGVGTQSTNSQANLKWATVTVWLFAISLAALALLREIDVPVTDSLWAEDGSIFIASATRADPLIEPFGEPYRGYFHTVPRLLAAAVVLFPPDLWPWVVSVFSLLIVLCVAVFVFYASEAVIPPLALRAGLAAWIIVNPVIPEVSANMANLHWFLVLAAFWACFAPDRSWLNWSGIVVFAASALSNPVTGFIAVVALIRAHKTRNRNTLILGAIGLTGAAFHVLAPRVIDWALAPGSALAGMALLIRATFGAVGGHQLVTALGPVPAIVLITLVAVVLFLVIWSTDGSDQRFFAGLATLVSVLWTIGLATLRGVDVAISAGRFVFVPAALLLGVFLVAASNTSRRFTVAASVALILVLSSNLFVGSRHGAPGWSVALAQARIACDDEEIALIPVHPVGWSVDVPCSVLHEAEESKAA